MPRDSILNSPGALANLALENRGIGKEINNFANYQTTAQGFRDNAFRRQATNPYDTSVADQSRAAQLALMQQMRAQQAGPSLVAMQGQRAMGQMGQQALMQGGRGAMLGAQGGSTGLAGDVGQARLAEIMKSQGGIGGAAGALRGADLRSADAQMGAGFAAQGLEDQRSRFYAQMGTTLDRARAQAAADNDRLRQATEAKVAGLQLKLGTSLLAGGATALSTGLGK